MWLKPFTTPSKGSILSLKISQCFKIDINLGPKYHKATIFLDSRALIFFLDKEFIKRYSYIFSEKKKIYSYTSHGWLSIVF